MDTGYLFDYYPLWVWGRLALQGASPYDQPAVREGLSSLGIVFNDPLSGHPPWTMWMYALYALFPFSIARALWGITVASGVVCFCWWACSTHLQSRTGPAVRLILILSFSPVLNNIRWGQANFLLCLGLMGFVHYTMSGDRKAAGLSLSFLLFKPHLFLPLFGFIAAASLREKDCRVALWCIAGLLLQCLMTLALSPAAFINYPAEYTRTIEATRNFSMPSIPIILSAWSGLPAIRGIIPAAGLIAGIWMGLKREGDLLRDIPLLLAISLTVAPYSWSHVYLPLLIPYLLAGERIMRSSRPLFYAVITVFAALQYRISIDTYMSLDKLMVVIPVTLLMFQLFAHRSRRTP